MRFTRLRLNGFKSFVDPTDLVIAPGLTGVVGPNGCGKSNLLEALRWVMGENRPTAMRGGGMEDVIFAGAATRGARHFAEVVLHIDNADRLAPAEFNDADALEIVRRITRDAGSAYKINTRDVRARDVSMLFADAATGAQSPALVRQGQISELINAKPKSRRRILEDAAGIGGLYQRRHEAELRLRAAEQNLARVDDVVEQLAQQLAQLARQARQAARYRAIGTDLRRAEGVLLSLRWSEAATAAEAARAALAAAAQAATLAEAAAARAATERGTAEAALPAVREEEAVAAALVARTEAAQAGLEERGERAEAAIRGFEERLAQIDRDAGREEALNRDAADSIAQLEREAADLARAFEGQPARQAAADRDADAAATALAEAEAGLSRRTEEVARLAARHQSAARLRDDCATAARRSEAAAAAARQAVTEAEAATAAAEAALASATEAQAAAALRADRAEAAQEAADGRLEAVRGRESEARAARLSAEAGLKTLTAETTALDKLLSRGAGARGQVIDAIDVAPGYEAALGAALADDLRAPVGESGSGWGVLPPYDRDQPLPPGAAPLAAHVEVPKALGRRIAQVGVVDATDGPALQPGLAPGQRLVSREGDMWRWDGYRAAAADAPSAAALRLQQRNRLRRLRDEEARARTAAADAERAHALLGAELAAATETDKAARAARREADAAVAAASRAQSRAEADRNIAAGRLESQRQAVARHGAEAEEAAARLADAAAAMADLPDLDAARSAADALRADVAEARTAMLAARTAADELRRAGAGRARRAQAVDKDLAGWRDRQGSAGGRLADLARRRDAAAKELTIARQVPAQVDAERATLAETRRSVDLRLTAARDALAEAEARSRAAVSAEREAERAAGAAREARAAAQARSEAAGAAVAAAAERIAEALDCTPEALATDVQDAARVLSTVERAETEIAKLRRQRDALGAVNLRAEEDAAEVQTEHDTLTREKADLEEAIAALRTGISGLNREGRERLLTAFEQVNANFARLFVHLFGGGEARLELVESDDPLEAGLEILCQPPGKKLSTLSLLSGGEQTLTALALIFAVFQANPAPICVLDEVDAPLDDANVTRFCDLLDAMTRQTDTRFLIITHHAVTMARMDRLFGVTMAEQGVSQLVSVDLKRAEQMVA
ncbi:chromosome segregation protein SMC [Rhodobacteraceae bacterium CCMM004]|nr:chromosome segregation protein SMC [Rhodobacteraceae bacterium CCMM004]